MDKGGKRYSDLGEHVGKTPYDKIVNPDGVYSGMARRNAHLDGEFVPQEHEKPAEQPKRPRR